MELIKRLVEDRDGKLDDKGNIVKYNNYYVVADIDGKRVSVMVKPVFSQDSKLLSLLAKKENK